MGHFHLYPCLLLLLISAATPAPAPANPSAPPAPLLTLSTARQADRDQVLSRQKRFFLGNVSFGSVGLVGARFQIFPRAPLGATNIVAFNLNLEVPRSLAFLIPGQG
eukprot:GFUD01095532.1.p1 GENE.GFUD01095532.1~~GFUD01095532.1.p1  ORF type:complete len:107 (+),score=28.64 GFUD01095532.1:47-367(+)